MLKTSKVTRPKSTRTKLKSKIITTTTTTTTTTLSNRKLQHRIGFITKKTLSKPPSPIIIPSSLQPSISSSTFSSTKSSSSSSSLTLPMSSTISSSSSSAAAATSSSSLLSSQQGLLSVLKSIFFPFTTIFNSPPPPQQQSPPPPPQQQQLSSITSHLQQLHHKHNNEQFDPITTSFPHNLVSQLMTSFHSTKVQLAKKTADASPTTKKEPVIKAKATTTKKPKSVTTTPTTTSKKASKVTTNDKTVTTMKSPTPIVIQFEYLDSPKFQDAMKKFGSEVGIDSTEALLTFTGAVAEHYPSKPLEFVAKFIRLNRDPFRQLFQHQIAKAISSLDKNTKKQNEIVQIIFDEYHDLTTLILKLRGKGHSDEEIGSLLRKIYPKHFHKEIDDVLLPKDSSQYSPPERIKIDGQEVLLYFQLDNEDFLKAIAHEIIPILQNRQQFLDAMRATTDSFIEAFKCSEIQTIIRNSPDWYSNHIHTDKIHQLLEQFVSPSFQPLDFKITLTARDGQAANDDSTDPISLEIKQLFNTIYDFKKQHFSFPEIILPILDEYLSLSYQQNLIVLCVVYLQKLKNGQKPTSEEESIFQLVTGLTFAEYQQQCDSGAWQLALHGPQGIGKSLLLLIIFFMSVFNVHCPDTSDVKTSIDILTCYPTSKDSAFQIVVNKDDNGKIVSISFNHKIKLDFSSHSPSFHGYDELDSPNTRSRLINPSNQQPQVTSQTPRTSVNPDPMIKNGIEIRFLSAQESNFHSQNQDNGKNLQTKIPIAKSKSIANPIYLRMGPSSIQTLIVSIKSSLYRHRYQLLQSTLISSTPQSIRSKILSSPFFKALQSISYQDLVSLGLFNEWDNGKSLSASSSTLRNPMNSTQIESTYYPVFSCDWWNPANISSDGIQPNQDPTNNIITKLLQHSFHHLSDDITTRQKTTKNNQRVRDINNNIIPNRLPQLLYELRLLPYVSPSMRSVNTFYSQFVDQSTPNSTTSESKKPTQLSRFDLFTRFFPRSFEDLYSTYNQLKTPPRTFDALTQFSQLPFFFGNDEQAAFEDFIKLSSKLNIFPSSRAQFQQDIDQLPHKFFPTTLQHYLATDLENVFSRRYTTKDYKYHYYIDTTVYKYYDHADKQKKCLESTNFPNDTVYYDRFIKPNTSLPPISPTIFLPHQGKQSQYLHINNSITQTIQFIYNAYKNYNTPVTALIGTGGAPNYPIFDNVFIYLHPSSNNDQIVIGIHFSQLTTAKKKKPPKLYLEIVDLYKKLLKCSANQQLFKYHMDDWSILSSGAKVRYTHPNTIKLSANGKKAIQASLNSFAEFDDGLEVDVGSNKVDDGLEVDDGLDEGDDGLIVCATSLQVVLITASGLQGEQPLVFGCMQVREVGKLDP